MSAQGMIRTLLWTQINDAVNADFGIELPRKAGPEMEKLLNVVSAELAKNIPAKTEGGPIELKLC